MLPDLVRRFYGPDNIEEQKRGEICEVIGSCEYPQFWLVDRRGKKFWWCQHLTRTTEISPEERADYWKERALKAESILRQKEPTDE